MIGSTNRLGIPILDQKRGQDSFALVRELPRFNAWSIAFASSSWLGLGVIYG
ncbi:hypothetical protein EC9_26100 [Rosistilla ulvae]|uniref:Uncharacterized protein n=1 Tax=Rosistilla ulvae TaxID=1930277 RepID=A0A517M0L5_9BACT|nr:hypothetical protein EC9_26100 [Rosistilla ulvae]